VTSSADIQAAVDAASQGGEAERDHALELLRQSEERFRLMVESVRDYAIFMLDPDGYVTSWNKGAELNKGYKADEIIGRHFSVFYPQEKLEARWPQHELEVAQREGRFEDEGWRLRKDGTRFWANVVITALHDADGRHRGFVKVTRDLTASRRIHALEEQERRLTQFLALLGHELRNPMTPIANAVSIMQLEEPTNPRMRAARDILARQVTHLRRLVDELLDVGRISTGKVHLVEEVLSLQQVVDDAAVAVRPTMVERGHEFIVNVPEEPMHVLGDAVRLVQVLTNLLNNAAKFTPPDGRVSLSLTATRDGRAELGVRDNGPGILPDELPGMFKLFVQGGNEGPGGTQSGLGIGLSLVQQLVHLHGGDVSAFSTGVAGEGAEFLVHLPLVPAPDA
jgi:PAS domain S-box-containing protein